MNKKNDELMLEVMKIIASDRKRTNILRIWEQKLIAYLVQRVPSWISSDTLTFIGFLGNIIVFLSFILGAYINSMFLLIGILGFTINWFGDSLDGRLAYYRKKPRKWYGFSLDFITDWVGVILIGLGFVVYTKDYWEIIGFAFVVLYGWEMILALLHFKITSEYTIDSGFIGPTEVRIIISAILILEVTFQNSILYISTIATAILFIFNIMDTRKLLKFADERDQTEKESNQDKANS